MKKRIYFIENSAVMAMSIKKIVPFEEYDIAEINTVSMALELIKKSLPDMVIIDSKVNETMGIDIAKQLRADKKNDSFPIILLDSESDNDMIASLEAGVDEYIKKPFDNKELYLRIRNLLVRMDKSLYFNKLTELPGNIEMQSSLDTMIRENKFFSMLYCDIDNLKSYNEIYGYEQGNKAIKLLSDIIKDTVSEMGQKGDFIGNIGGDDFGIILNSKNDEEVSNKIIEEFDKRILELYNPIDKERGYIVSKSRLGIAETYPVMTISIAIVTNEKRKFTCAPEVITVATEIRGKLKSVEGSTYFKDKRNGNTQYIQ